MKPVPQECLAAATAFAERNAPKGYSGHCIRMCDMCGHMDWVSSTNNASGVVVVWTSQELDRPCPACLDVLRRAPELSHWVLNVVSMLELRLKGPST